MNALGFPFIFRAAPDVRATALNEERELAATRALADLAKEGVPDSVCRAYGVTQLKFGRECLIPKPFDLRVPMWEASSVAEGVMRMITRKEEVFFLPAPASTSNLRRKIWTRSRSARHTCRIASISHRGWRCTVGEVVNVAANAVVDAQENDTCAHPRVDIPVEPELIGKD